MAPTTMEFLVQPRPPFAFGLALDYLRRSPSSIVESIGPETYRRAIRLANSDDARPALLTVRDGGSNGLLVTLAGSSVTMEDRGFAERLVRRLFRVDDDVAELETTAMGDPIFAPIARACRGLRPVIIPDLFEAIVWAILGQQVNIAFAAKIKRELVERFGERLAVDGVDYLVFPRPARLAAVREGELAAIQLSRQKIRYVLGVARDVAEGRLDLDDLTMLPVDEAQARLESVLGIGRWTAEYVLLRGMGYRDVIPAADGGLRRIIGYQYGLGRSASEAEVREYALRWAGWRGYAAFYWWFTLQQGWVSGDEVTASRV